MDLTKLGRTEQVLSAAGILLFIFSFLPWYSITVGIYSGHADAWSDPSGFNDWFPTLLLLAYGVLLALPAFGVEVNVPLLASGVNRAFIGLVLSAFALLLFAIQGLTYPSFEGYGGPSWGYFVSLVIVLAAGVQSYLGFTQQGGNFAAIGASLQARTKPATPAAAAAPEAQPEDPQPPVSS